MQSLDEVQSLVASLVVAQTMSRQKVSATSKRGHSACSAHGERHAPLRQTAPAMQSESLLQNGFGRSSTRQRPLNAQ